jgi:hypothetical protein
MKNIFIALPLVFLISCGDNKLAKVETLGSFRVLAIQTSAPEITQAAGLPTITVKPFISDVYGAGRTVTGTIDTCVDPGISFGASPTCDDNPTKVSYAYSVNTGTLTSMNTGWGPDSSAITIPDTIFSGKSAREKFNGVNYLVIFSFTVDGAIYNSFRRISLTNRTIKNTNPILSALTLNGGALTMPNNGDVLGATYSGVESYDYLRVDGVTETRTEKLVMAWYISSGTLNLSKVNASETVKYTSDSPSTLMIVGVLRDERGGVAVIQSTL